MRRVALILWLPLVLALASCQTPQNSAAQASSRSTSAALFEAARAGKLHTVRRLLKNYPKPSRENLNDALLGACQSGNLAVVKELIGRGADVNYRDSTGGSVLRQAVGRATISDPEAHNLVTGSLKIVKYLLANGADPNLQDRDGNTCLYVAAFDKKPQLVRLLITHGADPNLANQGGDTPLMAAGRPICGFVQANRTRDKIFADVAVVIEALLGAGAEVDATDQGGFTPLVWAAFTGYASAVEVLINRGADVNHQTRGGETALFYAAQQDDTVSLKLLLRQGARIDVRTSEGTTAREVAEKYGHKKSAMLLKAAEDHPDKR